MQNIHRIAANKISAKLSSFAEPLEQRIAPAGVFRWNATGGGTWNTPANWSLVSGDAGQGFPNGDGDEALLTNAIAANSTILIPDNVEIVLGKLRFDDNNSYTITSAGSGHLTMDNGADQATILSTNANGIASHFIFAPIHLNSDTTFSNSTNSPLVIGSAISENFSYRGVTKNGTGVVTFAGPAANTYTGETTVLDGLLKFAKNDGIQAVGGNQLSIGELDGLGNPRVVFESNEQIPNDTRVVVIGKGILDLANFSETFDNLTPIGNASITTGTGTLTVNTILAGTYDPGAVSTISGFLNLAGAATVSVLDTSVEGHLKIDAVIKGSSGLTKNGTGTLTLASTAPQQYTGQTLVSQGKLLLKGDTSDAGISNDIRIEKDGVLRVESAFEIPDLSVVTVAGGRLEFATSDDFRNLFLDGGTVSIENTATFSIRPSGSVSVPESISAGGSSIEGPGKFRLMDNLIGFAIGETNDDVDLNVTAPMIGTLAASALVKLGSGKLALMEDGTYTGGNIVLSGTLLLGGAQSSETTLTGGRVQGAEYSQVSVKGISASGGRIEPSFYFASAGNVMFGPGAVFAPHLDYFMRDLEVTGTVEIAGSKLDLSVLSLSASQFSSGYTIIENDGNDPVIGTFADLPEGATLKTPGGNFTISYVGGSGNDVTLKPVFVTPTILAGGKAATFIDVDGDLVTVKITKGTLTADNFKLLAVGAGAQLQELRLDDAAFEGTSLKFSAVPKNGLGDRQVNLVALKSMVDFTTISIPGDVGNFEIGSSATPTPAFKSMTVKSIGYSSPVAAEGNSQISKISGTFGSLKVKGDVFGANVQAQPGNTVAGSITIGGSLLPGTGNGVGVVYVNGNIGKVAIAGDIVGSSHGVGVRVMGNAGAIAVGGSLIGGTGFFESGFINIGGNAGSISIGRDLIGSEGTASGTIKIGGNAGKMKIGGGIFGDTGTDSGSVKIGGNLGSILLSDDLRGGSGLNSGSVLASGTVKSVKIGGSVSGGASGSGLYAKTFGSVSIGRDLTGTLLGRAVVCATGNLDPADAASALAIASITVGRDVSDADVLAGFSGSILQPLEADAQIGKIAVKGDWSASRALAGVQSGDGFFANGDDQPVPGGTDEIASRIPSIVIGGSMRGTVELGDSYGFSAEQIGTLTVAGKKIALDPAAKDAITFGPYNDMAVREI